MTGFDVQSFVRTRQPLWEQLERLLARCEEGGVGGLSLADARRLATLYRAVSSDLLRARGEEIDAPVVDYLNALVARAHALVHGGYRNRGSGLLRFLRVDFPRLYRREGKLVLLAAAMLLSGAALGAVGMALDPTAGGVLVPDMHAERTPVERISSEEATGGLDDGGAAAAFAGFLFTHNIRVTYLVFALGLTFGIGTAALLFYNGIPLGALAVQYHLAGEGLFFWAWILPHGVVELTVVFIAGAAGLMLARAQWAPGRRRRIDAIVAEGKDAVRLVLGGMPLLVLAGIVEATISQMHEPVVRYEWKLLVAGLLGMAVHGYLLVGGRSPDAAEAGSPGSGSRKAAPAPGQLSRTRG
ncbi:MAG: stage II sporulation protein M [Myxococcota bacterium]|nr:stage II sporulation protein M [Myxococcota bacterium]MDW8363947.1 stage II sporulation protein M [Myxococcales bacterium]